MGPLTNQGTVSPGNSPGVVTVNGTTVRELGTKADAARDDIRVDGRRVKVPEQHRYLLLNKPRGYMTTRSDPERRPTVIDLLEGVREYVYPVGRLDFDSEGLLILTNDGDLAARLTQRARQDSVLVANPVRDALGDKAEAYTFSEAGFKRMKGIADPVPALRLRRA